MKYKYADNNVINTNLLTFQLADELISYQPLAGIPGPEALCLYA